MSLPTATCANCRLPKSSSQNSGRITQWLTTCSCELKQSPQEQEKTVDFCITCGKRVRQGRAGSFTQFIFRYDLCACDVPKFLVPSGASEAQQGILPASEPTFDEKEIDVDAEKFPLDRYLPVEVLGQGAAGTVYYCRDRLLRKRVIVKTLHSRGADQLVSFHREAKLLCKLDHPNIVHIMDFGATTSGTPYMVLDYSPGKSLDHYLKEAGPLPWTVALSIFSTLASALEYCHTHHVFHRDLKPSNILMTTQFKQSAIKLFDFGVAELQSDSNETQYATIVGTPAYMAPDQARGREYDACSEVYSFGCVLFESLTGVAPFTGKTALEILGKHAHDAPPLLSDFAKEEIPDSVQSIVSRCLNKNPEGRYQSMDELGLALRTALQEYIWLEEMQNEAATTTAPNTSSTCPGIIDSNLTIPTHIKIVGATAFLIIIAFCALVVSHEQPITHTTRSLGPGPSDMVADILTDKLVCHSDGNLTAQADFVDEDMEQLVPFAKTQQVVSLAGTGITKKNLKVLRKFKNLKELDLSYTKIDNSALRTIGAIKTLRTLKLNGTGIGDSGINQLSNLQDLKELWLQGTHVTGAVVMPLDSHSPELRALYVDGCINITRRAVDSVAGGLHTLSIAGCPKISEADVSALRKKYPKCNIIAGKIFVAKPQKLTRSITQVEPRFARIQSNATLSKYLSFLEQDHEFRKFFVQSNWYERSDYRGIKNHKLLSCLQDPEFQECMKNHSLRQEWQLRASSLERLLQKSAERFHPLIFPADDFSDVQKNFD